MVIVTATDGRERSGCLVGFASQCSIDPLRFMAFISKANHTYRVALNSAVLAVHLLGPDDRALAERFGSSTGDETDKFEGCDWAEGPSGVPLLTAASAWFAGPVLSRTDSGDHVGFLIEPTDSDVERWRGQLGFQQLRDLPPGHPA